MAFNGMPLNQHPFVFGKVNDFEDFEYDGLPADEYDGLPAEWSSASVSGSDASSSFGPHTPTSGRSTPPFSASFDFGSSFASTVDTAAFDITPPSSATSTYFPSMVSKSGGVHDGGYPVFPVTPSRAQLDFSGHLLSGCGAPFTPTQPVDCGYLMSQLEPSPLPSTPHGLPLFDHLSDHASPWAHADSPVTFEGLQQSPSRLVGARTTIKSEFEAGMPSPAPLPSTVQRRARMEEARQKTTALHKAQQQQQQQRPQTRARRHKKQERRRAASPVCDSVTEGNRHPCPEFGCPNGPFRRKEDLKRHIISIHGGESYLCQFCDRIFNRTDNLIQHLTMHADPERRRVGKARVKYFEAAVLVLQQMKMRNGTRRRATSEKVKREDSVE